MTNEIFVAFVGMPGKEKAVSIWRRTEFKDGANPTVTSLEEALIKKYGKQHIRQTKTENYILTHRKGATNLGWLYGPNGNRIMKPDSLKQTCINGPKPWVTARLHRWNEGCGVRIRAELVPQPGNRMLTQVLNITVVNQKELVTSLNTFDAELKAAVEKKGEKMSDEPEL